MIRKLILFIGVIVFIMATPMTIQAQDGDETKGNVQAFTVKPVLPSNQDKDITNYISISTDEKKLKQEVQFLITNSSDEPVEVQMQAVNALTSPHGVIQYLPSLKENNTEIIDKKYDFKSYTKLPKKVKVEGGESETVTATVEVENMEGTLLGAIGFKTVKNEEEEDQGQFTIKNEINNIIGVQINFPTDQPEMDLEIGDPYVDPMPSYYAVRLPVTQASANILKDVDLKYEVAVYKGEKVFNSKDKMKFGFAPKTKTNISLPWEFEEIEKDKKYVIKGKFTKGDKEFPFEKVFEFKEDPVKAETKKLLEPPFITGGKTIWPYLLIIPIALLIGYVIYLRQNKWILFSNEEQASKQVERGSNLYQLITHLSKAEKGKYYEYKHYYKLKQDDDEDFYYEHIRTKKVRNK